MINNLFKNRYFLSSIQFITLFIFVVIIYGSIGISTNDPHFAKVLRNTNLSNLIVWSYWWPIIIVTAIIFGRYWCSICPMELITSFFSKIGFRKKTGKILKTGWIITLFYAIILVLGIHTLAIHRIPQYMAIYMLVLFAVAVVVGLIWEKRTFCTYVCPIGHLLGLYSLLSFNKLTVKDKEVCESCETKDCIHKENHYNFIGRSCTSGLYPPKITDNKNCILCGQCFKSCTKDNISIKKTKFAAGLFSNIKLKWAEIAFFMLISGFVIYEILSEWNVTKAIVMAVPDWVNQSLNISADFTGTVKALTLFVVLPLIFYSFFAFLLKIFAKETWKTGFSNIVLAILPITASMHLLKAFLKTTSRIPYWKYVFSDPKGVETAEKIMQNKDMLQSNFLETFISPTLSVLSVLLPVLGLILSFFVIKKKVSENKISKLILILVVLVYSSIFITTMIAWKVI